MSQKPETVFRARIAPKLKELPNTWVESIQQKAIRGTPDILVCCNGYFIALEIKATANAKIDKLQLHKLDRIQKAGGIALIVHPENWSKVYDYIKGIANQKRPNKTNLQGS